jgi:hypothetical protein
MTMAIWQDHPDHSKFVRDLLRDSRFQDVLGVLQNSRPATSDTEDASRCLGRYEGWMSCYETILSLANEQRLPIVMEETYEPETTLE